MPYSRRRRRGRGACVRRRVRRSLKARRPYSRRRSRKQSSRFSKRSQTRKLRFRVSGRRRLSLRKRVKKLENVAKCHHDFTARGLDPSLGHTPGEWDRYYVLWNGAKLHRATPLPVTSPWDCQTLIEPGGALGVASKFLGWQNVPRVNQRGDLPGMDEVTNSQNRELRTSMRTGSKIFVKKASIRGRIYAPELNTNTMNRPVVSTIAGAFDPTVQPQQVALTQRSDNPWLTLPLSKAKIWIVLLRDRTPAISDIQGTMTPTKVDMNDLNQAMYSQSAVAPGKNLGPLECQFKIINRLDTEPGNPPNEPTVKPQNSLKMLGMSQAFRHYGKPRYKIMFKKCITLDLRKAWVDFKLDIPFNQVWDYRDTPAVPDQQDSFFIPRPPVNHRYILTFCSSDFQIETEQGLDTGKLTGVPFVTNLASRLYFQNQ